MNLTHHHSLTTLIVLLSLLLLHDLQAQKQDRPNIVWLVSEDNSKHYLSLYDRGGASMPNVERLARNGLVFNHAFSMAPVCSVARSTIISGCYAPRIGAQYHRRSRLVPMPEGLEMFPYYLREAGYYATNNAKEDYNILKSKEVWDVSSRYATYRNRKEGQPFFHVQNFGTTHEGQLHFKEIVMQREKTVTDPESIQPFPYHPNTPVFRYSYARYHDLHTSVDRAIGEFIGQLEADGVLDDTFIFYYGDHGGVLPGSKGYVYERGLHVPLVVYVPKNWRHLAPAEPGSRIDGFVQFIDLGPTVLNLAQVSVPEQMDGQPFLGTGVSLKSLNARKEAFGYADRFDEKYDLVRSLRIGKYKYIRSYQPFNFDGLHNFYRYRMLAYQEWLQMHEAGKLNEAQSQFFLSRSPEGLFDLEEDPHETNNLVRSGQKKGKLKKMRKALQQKIESMPDLSLYPEPYLVGNAWQNPVEFGEQRKGEIARLLEIADLSLLPYKKARTGLEIALQADSPWERYWAYICCTIFGEEAAEFYEMAEKAAREDAVNLVRVRAAEFLGLTQAADPVPLLTECLQNSTSAIEANLVLNTIVLLSDTKPGYEFSLDKDMVDHEWLKGRVSLVRERLIYLGVDTKVD